MPFTILISGANRGLGLELVNQYAKDGWRVLACCRDPQSASELKALADENSSITLHRLDVTDASQIQSLAQSLAGQPVDILFNNAGIYGPGNASFGNTDEKAWLECLRINTIAPMKVSEAFVEHVAGSELKLVVAMSSKMGSMADNGSGGSYIYRSSKAALNAVMKSISIDLSPRGIKVAILHPGWVLTDMGGPNAEITTEQSVKQLKRNLEQVNADNSGSFWEIDGSIIPW